jgi:Tol biopolymer transport system component
MPIVRALTAAAKPALVSGTLAASAIGGWFAVDSIRPHDAPSAFRQVQGHGQRLLVSEFGDTADTIVAIDPADIGGRSLASESARTRIATVDHAPGYGIFATLAPDGNAIAYTALPPDTAKPGPDAPAHAAVIDIDGNVTLLAGDVDLLIAPVWSPDAASIVVRKNTPADAGAGAFDLLLLGRDGSRSTITTWHTAAVFPIAFAPGGSKLYFATLNTGGSDLYAIAPDGSDETKIAHLTDQIARDWQLSPDGATLAFSVAESGPEPAMITRTLDLATGAIADAVAPDALAAGPPSTGIARAEFNPTYDAAGRLTIAALKLDGGADAVAIDASGATLPVTNNPDGIDLPLDWSPDGATLAVRNVDGMTPFDATTSHVELVRDGERERVSDNADVQIVGWLP